MKKNKKIRAAVASATAAAGLSLAVVAQECAPAAETPTDNDISSPEIVRNLLISLSGTTTPPAPDTNGGFLISQLLSEIQDIDNGVTRISSLNIINPVSSVLVNNFQNSVVVEANSLTIEVEGGLYSEFTNTSDLIFSNIIRSRTDELLQITISANSLAENVSDSEFLREVFLDLITTGLNGISAPTNQNQLVLYEIILTQAQSIFPAANATHLVSMSVGGGTREEMGNNIVIDDSASTITIRTNLFSTTTNGLSINTFENFNDDLVISNIGVANGAVINIDGLGVVSNMEPLYNEREVIIGGLRLLEQINGIPAQGTNVRVFYDTFLAALRTVDSNIDSITSFTISDIGQISTTLNFSQVNIPTNIITFVTTGGQYSTYSNLNGTTIMTGITVDTETGLITSAPLVNNAMQTLVAAPTNTEIIIREAYNLTNFTSLPEDIPENQSVRTLWTALQDFLRSADLVNGNPNMNLFIESIVFMNPETTNIISISNGNFINVEQNSMFITTRGATVSNNWTNFLQEVNITSVQVNDGSIQSVGVITGLSVQVLPSETIKAFGENLDGVSTVPTNSSLSVLYNAILMRLIELHGAQNGITQITDINIINPNVNVTSTATSVTFIQGSLSITTNSSSIAEYTNSNNDFTLNVSLNAGQDLITSAAGVSDLTPNPTDEEVVTNAIIGLASLTNISNSQPPVDPSQLVIYNALLGALRTANANRDITIIHSISINSVESSLQINQTATSATITANNLTIEANDGTDDITFVNENTPFNIPDIVISNDSISSVGTITGLIPSVEGIALAATLRLNGAASRPTEINSGLIWDAVLADIQTSLPIYNITDLGGVVINNPPLNLAFRNNRIEIVTFAMRITSYEAYLVPNLIQNTSPVVITFDINNGLLSNVQASSSWSIPLTTNQQYFEFLWVQLVNSTDLSTVPPDALLILDALDERMSQALGNDNVVFGARENVVATTTRPSFSNFGISWFANSLFYSRFLSYSTFGNALYNATIVPPASTGLAFTITRNSNGSIATINPVGSVLVNVGGN